jgi:hypothetical protein
MVARPISCWALSWWSAVPDLQRIQHGCTYGGGLGLKVVVDMMSFFARVWLPNHLIREPSVRTKRLLRLFRSAGEGS